MALLPFARVARLLVFAYRSRTKTRATRVNFKKCPFLNSKRFLCLLCPRKVEIIPSDMVFAMKIFARVARVSDLANLIMLQNAFRWCSHDTGFNLYEITFRARCSVNTARTQSDTRRIVYAERYHSALKVARNVSHHPRARVHA